MAIDVTASLSELVIADPRRAKVLESFELDYCCNGEVALADAVKAADLDLSVVQNALNLPAPADGAAAPTVPGDNAALAHDIVDTHHAFMWEEMPRLAALVDKVATVHGARHTELAALQETYHAAVTELEPHMTREERQIFPAISRFEKGQPVTTSFVEPIAQLRAEHEVVGDLFKKMRAISGGYEVPEDGCNSYRMMMRALAEMETDLHEHIHKENNILFPRVLELEADAAKGE